MRIDTFQAYLHRFYTNTYAFDGHRHPQCEANIVLDGSLEVTCADTVICLHAGEAALWNADNFHRSRIISEGITEFISLHFTSADITLPGTMPVVYHLSESDLALVRILDEETEGGKAKINRAAHDLLEALLLRLDRKTMEPELSKSPASLIYRDAVNLMSENLGEKLNTRMISQHCGVCLTSLKNAFSVCAGKGVMEYFLDLKMEKAREMLLRGINSETIAVTLGFSSPSYFSQCFRRENGCSAREFVNSVKDYS